MQPVALDPSMTVSGQLAPGDFATLAAHGVRMVISNRPDGEDPGQLPAAEAARLAAEHGMAFRHVPISLPTLSPADIESFADALAAADGPAHAFCRSGMRSGFVWGIDAARSGRLTPDALLARGRESGVDFTPALNWLAHNPG
ncbi:MAG: TIGR01244 family sulfur transferase [Janthinobacterium lividum]